MNFCRSLRTILPAGILLLTSTASQAQITGVPLFWEGWYQQTGPSTTNNTNWTFDARIFETNPGDATTGTLTYPGPGSPGTYTPVSYSPVVLDYSASFTSQANLQAAFPNGTYTTNWSGGTAGSGTASVDFTQSYAYSTNIPTFTATTYSGLQGLNPSHAFTANWAAFGGALPNNSFVFFDVYNAKTGQLVYNQDFLASSTTSAMLPAGTLKGGTSYVASLDFSNRIPSTFNGVDTTLGFDRNTAAIFSTSAVPESSTLLSFGLLALGGAIMTARKRRTPAA